MTDDDLSDIRAEVDAFIGDDPEYVGATFSLDDTGNGRRLHHYEGADLRWVAAGRDPGWWRSWTGTHWVDAHTGAMMQRAVRVVDRMRDETKRIPEVRREEHRLWTSRSRSVGSITNMLKAVTATPELWAAPTDFDAHPHLLNVANGTLDLSGGGATLRAHDRDDLITRYCGTPYQPDATSPLLDAFLDRFLPDTEERAYLLSTLAVAALIGGNPQRSLLMLLGPSTTGKTTLMKLATATLGGDYVSAVEASIFKANRIDAPRPDIIKALSARLVIATEASDAWLLDADQVKRVTGEDVITARGMKSNIMQETVAAFTPIITANTAPRIVAADEGVRRRLKVMVMDQVVPTGEDTGEARARLVGDPDARAAFLAALVRAYVDTGGRAPASTPLRFTIATEEVFTELDDVDAIMREMVNDGVLLRDPHTNTHSAARLSDVYAAYLRRAARIRVSRDMVSVKQFAVRLRALGYELRRSDGMRVAGHRMGQSSFAPIDP